VKIRRVHLKWYKEEVRDTLNRLDQRCFPRDELCSKRGQWWVVYNDEGEPVAFAGARPVEVGSKMIYLCRCGVVPEYRGRGLQKKLIRVRLRYARKAGFKTAVTDTADNVPSANNLIACGFTMYTPEYKWALDSQYWWKDL
jgi:GNAT superfamily N-acetyltransferase